jgi:methoxymalonate biosynthesis acyl carrier protein
MKPEAIQVEIRNHIRDEYRVAPDDPDFSDDVHLYDYGYIDSFGAVRLISFLESRFSVKFSDIDLAGTPLRTVREFASFISKRANGDT